MSTIPSSVFKAIRRIQIYTRRTVRGLLAGSYHSAFKGSGIEFEEVRHYQPGDDVRRIDWNVTARMSAPYVKNYREERQLTVMLVVDVSASSRFGSGSHLKSEIMAEVGAVLAFSAIENNDRVGLILFSSEVEKYLPPKQGVRHVLRVIRELLMTPPEHAGTDISKAMNFLGKVQKRRGICFLISDFLSSDYSKSMELAAKRHDLITLGLADPHEVNFPSLGLVTLEDPETQRVTVVDSASWEFREAFQEKSSERWLKHQRLMERVGGGFIALQTDRPCVPAIQAFFERRRRRLVR